VSIDTAGIQIDEVVNWTITDSSLSWRVRITDTTPNTCQVKVYDRAGTLKSTTSGTFGTIGTSTNCTGTITASNIVTEGAFTAEFIFTDEPGNTNASNKTGIYTKLFSNWNLVTLGDTNRTTLALCDMIENCTQVSLFNNTAKTFTTFSTATPSVNNDTQIGAGVAVYIYVSANDSLIVNDFMETRDDEWINMTDGWNTMGLLLNTSMNTTIHAIDFNSDKNITWGSWLSASNDKFYTCSQARETCTGTTATAIAVELKKGFAVWALTNGNIDVNRTKISG
jgi:hypothetical protein